MIILDTNSLVKAIIVDQSHDDAARFRGLLERAKTGGIPVGIPAPVFAEFLVRADDATTEMLAVFEKKQAIRILPFDKKAAHECALLDRVALASGNKKHGAKDAWQKVKIDRQIIAIARVHSAQLILTTDADLTALAHRVGLSVQSIGELPIPDDAKQQALDLAAPEKKDG